MKPFDKCSYQIWSMRSLIHSNNNSSLKIRFFSPSVDSCLYRKKKSWENVKYINFLALFKFYPRNLLEVWIPHVYRVQSSFRQKWPFESIKNISLNMIGRKIFTRKKSSVFWVRNDRIFSLFFFEKYFFAIFLLYIIFQIFFVIKN